MFLPLTRKIPLRDSTAWGRFASIETIPRIYGRATIAPVAYDDTGRLFVVADHPVKSIVSVSADGVAVTAFRLYHQADTTGKTVAFLELQTPVTIGTTELSATVEGLQNPITGLLMTNPADVAHDLLQWSTGQTLDRSRFAVFASDCQRAGVKINGALADQSETIRTTLDSTMDSAGVSWSTSADSFGMVWPALSSTRVNSVSNLAVSKVETTASLSAISTVITVRFGYDWQSGDYTGSVTYSAPEQVKQFGSIEHIIEAPYCATGRQASMLAEYWCKILSVPQYTASIEADRGISYLQVSDRISLVYPHLPGGSISDALVTGREYNPETGSVTLTCMLSADSLPYVEISGYSGRFTQQTLSGTKVTTGSGTIDLVIADDKGNVLAGAMATLDGATTTTADASGRVLFTGVATGNHTIEIRSNGYDTFYLQVTV